MIYESVRKMTVKEQMAFDLGYAKALGEIERLTDERDAAVMDMRRDSHCLQCKKHRSAGGDCLGFSMCGQDRPSWQWRGPCAENRRKEK